MAQQVEYPAIPGTQPKDYTAIIRALLAYVERESPSDKELRRYMRSRSFFDKDTADLLFDLIGIVTSKNAPTTLNDVGKGLHALDDDKAFQRKLFKEIAQRNEILTKYVFDALDERLYSVNEMYRVLTSYVYPGHPVTLVHFKNWMALVEAAGMLKYIGIRWGPSPLVEEVREFLNGIDIEEVLEEEAEDGDWEYEEGEDELTLPSEAPDAAAGAPLAAGEDDADGPDAPDLSDMASLPDAPPSPPPSSGKTSARPMASAGAAKPAPAKAVAPVAAPPPPMPTYEVALRLRSVVDIQEVQKVLEIDPGGAELALQSTAIDDAELAHNLEAIKGLWGTTTDKRPLGFEHFRIAARDYGTKSRKKGLKPFFLYRGLVAATCAFRPIRMGGTTTAPPTNGLDRFSLLETSGALSRHFEEDQSMDAIVTSLVQAGYGRRLDLLGMAPYLILAKQALADADDWVKAQEKAKDAKAVWEAVYERLHAGVFTIELIWLVRELARNDLWTTPGLKEASVVPTQEVLDIAFNLGLLPTPYAGNFASALWASRTLTGLCGDELGYEASLLYFGREAMPHGYERRPWDYFSRDNLRR